jgi:hypothetical protein
LVLNDKKRQFCILIATLLFSNLMVGQPAFFTKAIGGQGVQVGQSVCQFADSSLYILGYSQNPGFVDYDFILTKTDQFGGVIWTKFFANSGNDLGLGMTKTIDGNLLLIGTTEIAIQQNSTDALLIKVDTAGNELWRHTYGTPGNEQAKYVEELANGNIIFTGFAPDIFGSIDGYYVMTDSLGIEKWTSLSGGASVDLCDRVISISPDTLAAILTTTEFGNSDVRLTLLDSSGTVIYDTINDDPFQTGCQGIIRTSNNEVIVYGEREISAFSPFDFFIESYSIAGSFNWRKTFGGSGTDALFDMVEDSNGNFIGAGYSNSVSSGVNPINVAVVKTDANGNLIWSKEYGNNSIDIAYDIIPSLLGGYYLVGNTILLDDDIYLLHVDANGEITFVEENTMHNQILVSPNPADRYLTIPPFVKFDNLSIFDLTGRRVLSFYAVGDFDRTINTEALQDGAYILQLNHKQLNRICQKVIIKHSK